MVDTGLFENKVFDEIKTDLSNTFSNEFSDLSVYSEYVETPATFPCVSFFMRNDIDYQNANTIDSVGHTVDVTFEANIYANGTLKKTNAKRIAKTINTTMNRLGINRTFFNQIPNMDRSIFRITIRWNCKVKQLNETENINFFVFH